MGASFLGSLSMEWQGRKAKFDIKIITMDRRQSRNPWFFILRAVDAKSQLFFWA